MARKTKSQKIIAQLRRQIKLAQLQKDLKTQPVVKLEKESFRGEEIIKPDLTSKPQLVNIGFDSNSLSLIKKDIFKTLSLTAFIIGFEFILYWILEKGGDNILKRILSIKFL